MIRWTDGLIKQAERLRTLGWSYRAISEEMGVSYQAVVAHVGAAAQRKRSSARAGKYAIGDRVVYHPIKFGNSDIDGWEGTVIFVDGTEAPYTVRFDTAWIGGLTEERVGNKNANSLRCWFCREENLSLVGKEPSQSVKKTKVRQ